MEKKKLFVFDIDGTVLNDTKGIPESTKEAISYLNKKHEVAIATGRNREMAMDIIKELGLSTYIVCNGAAAYVNHEPIYTNYLDEEEVNKIVELADKNNHQIVFETVDELRRRSKEPNERVTVGMKSVDQPLPPFERDYYQNHPLVQCLLFYSEDEAHIYEVNQFKHFRFVRWHETAVDVLPHDGSKYFTIERLAKRLEVEIENVIAFGDGLNDLEMIQNVGTGVAMGNAKEEVKAVADYVTNSNLDDGISNALYKLEYLT